MDVEFLISLVRIKPYLYSKTDKRYKDLIIKQNAWKEIAGTLNATPSAVERAWNALRIKLVPERKKNKVVPSGSGATERKNWAWYQDLSFSDEFVTDRKTISNIRGSGEEKEHPVSEEYNAMAEKTETNVSQSFDDHDEPLSNKFTQDKDPESVDSDLLDRTTDRSPQAEVAMASKTKNVENNTPSTVRITTQTKKTTQQRKTDGDVDLQILEALRHITNKSKGETALGELVAHEVAQIEDMGARRVLKRKILAIIYSENKYD